MPRKTITPYEFKNMAAKNAKPSKYRAIKTEVNGIKFDSRGEAAWYAGLVLREQAGEIRNLKRQVEFVLQEEFRDEDGHWIRACKIVVDATYEQRETVEYANGKTYGWRFMISDFKGGGEKHATEKWKLQWKLLKGKLRGKGYRFEVVS